jgi:2-polyprenyl-3-methyl-5-hydroxy-6-metoxy-1,4-benzoquinol methylase
MLAMIGKNRQQTILDVGCGNGYLANYLIAKGFNVYGTDASEKGIAIAKQSHPDRFFVQDLSTGSLPVELSNLKFDVIISTEVIEHLYDPEGFISFCGKALEPSGELIISTPYHGYLKNLLLSIYDKWDTHMNPLWYGGHIKLWSKNTLTTALTNAGFKFVAFKGCGRIPYFWKSMIIKAKLD